MGNDACQSDLLELMIVPAFSARDGVIDSVNDAARALFLEPGMDVQQLIKTGREEYDNLTEGSLFLSMEIMGAVREVAIYCQGDRHIFAVDRENENGGLRMLGLAAETLREPLGDVMAAADQMFPELTNMEDPELLRYIAQVNRGLYRMLRAVSNMSDAGRYLSDQMVMQPEPTELGAFLREIFEKTQTLASSAGVEIRYSCPAGSLWAMVDRQKLERAVYNLLSNSLKYTPRGGEISMDLERSGETGILKITDNGEGIRDGALSTIFARFQREPSLEDSRSGIGLGLPMAAKIASAHGGALLIQNGKERGTVSAMSIPLTRNCTPGISTPVMRVDYAGERDHGLVELSECLPWDVFEAGSIN